MTLEQFTHTYEQDPSDKVSGLFRTFQYHDSMTWFMTYYIVVGIWIFCLLNALSQFVIAYAVQLWYFTPYLHEHKDAPYCSLFRGYYIGAGYHIGSIAFGSLVVTALEVPRIMLGALAQASELERNTAIGIIAKCFFCCITCYERCIEFLNKSAYMDIAINSTTFCTAARNALEVLHSQIAAVSFLNGATWVFKITGYALITSAGTFLVWIMVRTFWCFNNEQSSWYIEDPIVVCSIAAVICFAVSAGFMIVFDMVADTILYCFATEERRKQRGMLHKDVKYAPPSLERLIEKHSYGGSHPKQSDLNYQGQEHDARHVALAGYQSSAGGRYAGHSGVVAVQAAGSY